jgi:hypothetical protein
VSPLLLPTSSPLWRFAGVVLHEALISFRACGISCVSPNKHMYARVFSSFEFWWCKSKIHKTGCFVLSCLPSPFEIFFRLFRYWSLLTLVLLLSVSIMFSLFPVLLLCFCFAYWFFITIRASCSCELLLCVQVSWRLLSCWRSLIQIYCLH